MAHSFVSFGNQEVRVNDLDLAATCFVLMRQADASALVKMGAMFSQWIDSISSSGGNIDLLLDEYLVEADKIRCFSGFLASALSDVSSRGDYYPGELLSEYFNKVKIVSGDDYRADYIKRTILELQRIIGLSDYRN